MSEPGKPEDILSSTNGFEKLSPSDRIDLIMAKFEIYEIKIKDLEAIADSYKKDAEAYKYLYQRTLK